MVKSCLEGELTLPHIYEIVLDCMTRTDDDDETSFYRFTQADAEITYWYNRAIFIPLFGPVVKPNAKSEFGNELQQFVPLLNPDIDFAKTERQWFGEEQGYEHIGIVVIDNFLSPQVLEKVHDYFLMSTFWYEAKTPRYGQYVDAYLGDGMHDKLLCLL